MALRLRCDLDPAPGGTCHPAAVVVEGRLRESGEWIGGRYCAAHWQDFERFARAHPRWYAEVRRWTIRGKPLEGHG